MNLAEIKGLLLAGCGGVDLDDNSLRLFIAEGQKVLDRMSDFPHGQAEIPFIVNRADYFLVFPTRVRIVHDCWIRAAVPDEPAPLNKRDYITLRALHPDPVSEDFYAMPRDFAFTTSIIASLGSPGVDQLVMSSADVPLASDDPYDYKGIVLGPTPDATYIINVLTTAYSKELIKDDDESFWSKHHPLALVNAAMFKLEGFLRNASSARDFLAAAQQEITGINFDAYEDEMQKRPNYMGQ
jgi:hypothetical protein